MRLEKGHFTVEEYTSEGVTVSSTDLVEILLKLQRAGQGHLAPRPVTLDDLVSMNAIISQGGYGRIAIDFKAGQVTDITLISTKRIRGSRPGKEYTC
jgi:hypothetical protein